MIFRKKLFLAVSLVVLLHIVFGLYSVYDDGFFVYGFTAPERLVFHRLAGGESHITFSGAPKYVAGDLCLQECVNCPMHCYLLGDIKLVCDGGCTIVTESGSVLAAEEDSFAHIMKAGIIHSDVVFRCYEKVCGFDTELSDGNIYSTFLPESISAP